MAELQWSCLILLISLLEGLTSGSDDIAKSVCNGDSVQLFNKIQVNSSQTILSLYKNGDKEKIIASWNIEGETITQSNIVLDGHKNLWIINTHPTDEGKYILQNNTGNHNSSSSEVQLSVLVAPATTCKPTIKKVDNLLKASLVTGEECGKPSVSVYWLEYLGVKHEENRDLLELQPGRDAGTYYACIEGPAVSCTRSTYPSLNHCSTYHIETGSIRSVTGDRNDVLLGVTVAILVLQTVVIVNLLYKKLRTRMRITEQNQGNQEELRQCLPSGCPTDNNEEKKDAAESQV